ncbi:DExH-box ATP-dependent RNA helicase [Nymphaea thermarum]|nr:DExH-box ATP-dependent RNA helicase [Nymphaea thermarum]
MTVCRRPFPALISITVGKGSGQRVAAMSANPRSFRGGRRSSEGGRRGGGSGGRGGRGSGEQRWWDPVWRAERLKQMNGEVENLNENEWCTKMEQLKLGGEKEIIAKRNYGREGQRTLEQMAQKLGLYLR